MMLKTQMSNGTSSGIQLLPYAVLLSAETLAIAILQCMTVPVFLLFADYRSRTSHQSMLSLGLLDLVQLLTYFPAAFFVALDSRMPTQMEKILAALNMLSFDAMVAQHFLLAINRAYTIFRTHCWMQMNESETEKTIFLVLNCANWLWMGCCVVLFQIGPIGAKMDYGNILFTYDLALPYTFLYQEIEMPVVFVLPGISFCLYLAIIFKKNKIAPNGAQNVDNSQEVRVLLQASILFAGLLAMEVCWCLGVYFDRLETQLYSFCFIAYCALNPALYLTMNAEFRQRFVQMYSKKKPIASNTVRIVEVTPNNKTVNFK